MNMVKRALFVALCVAGSSACATNTAGEPRVIALIAGSRSHGYGEHEHYAGFKLLADCLHANVPGVKAVVLQGWPEDPKALEGVHAVVVNCDGGKKNLAVKHLQELKPMMARGVGLGLIHYALVVPKGEEGDLVKDWLGGYFEEFWSVNPQWEATFEKIPEHAVTRGVKPFTMPDEWYYHMRFRDKGEGVTPILSALPPEATRKNKDGPFSGNPAVRARTGMSEVVAWVYERPGGGRGFGFTGGHFHWGWAQDDRRKLVLNALAWLAGAEVPADGVQSATPTADRLMENIDKKKPASMDKEAVERRMAGYRR